MILRYINNNILQEFHMTSATAQTMPVQTAVHPSRPPEINAALSVLEQLHNNDDQRYYELRGTLPPMAAQLARSGENVTEDLLLDHINKGPEHLKALKERLSEKKRPQKRTYENVVAKLKEMKPPKEQEDLNDIDAEEITINNIYNAISIYGDQSLEEMLNMRNSNISPALISGDLEQLKKLIKAEDDYSYFDYNLHLDISIQKGHDHITEYLVEEHGIKLHKNHALCMADLAKKGCIDMVKFLVEKHDAHIEDKDNIALMRAAEQGHLDIVKYLIETDDTIDKKSIHLSLSRLFDANHENIDEIIEYFLQQDINIKLCDNNPLIWGAGHGRIDIVKNMVEKYDANISTDHDRALYEAGINLYSEIVEYLLENGAKTNSSRYCVIMNIIKAGKPEHKDKQNARMKVVGLLAENGADLQVNQGFPICQAIKNGELEMIKFLIKVDKNEEGLKNLANKILREASKTGDLDIVKYLVEHELFASADRAHALAGASAKGHLQVVKYLIEEQGADIHKNNDFALRNATKQSIDSAFEVIKYLVEKGANVSANENEAIKNSVQGFGNVEIAKYLSENGADMAALPSAKRRRLEKQFTNIDLWHKKHGENIPHGLMGFNPYFFRSSCFKSVIKMLEKEGYEEGSEGSNIFAYTISGLMGTEDRVLQYLEKWGDAGHQPLHDISYMINLPIDGHPDLKAWGDAVLKFGPEMGKLVKFSNRLERPAESLNKTREIVAEFVYERGPEHKGLAALCNKFNISEEAFEDALEIILKKRAKETHNNNIPDIAIDGKKFGMADAKFKKLPENDIRGLFLGEYTDCCQSISSVGRKCAKHGYVSENGGFYVITENDEIIGQSWAWRGQKGELVFDSLETLGNRVSSKSWQKLCSTFAKAVAKQDNDITSFNVGRSGATPQMKFNNAAKAAKPIDYKGYRDSKNQYQVWKRKI
jgi:ankyrin repeat protein